MEPDRRKYRTRKNSKHGVGVDPDQRKEILNTNRQQDLLHSQVVVVINGTNVRKKKSSRDHSYIDQETYQSRNLPSSSNQVFSINLPPSSRPPSVSINLPSIPHRSSSFNVPRASSSCSDSRSISLSSSNSSSSSLYSPPFKIDEINYGVSDEGFSVSQESEVSQDHTLTFPILDFTQESNHQYPLMQFHPVHQFMDRSEEGQGYDPSRIPAAVFERKLGLPVDWSVASNDSLFSIQLGRSSSLSRDQALSLGELNKVGDEEFSFNPPLQISMSETDNTQNDKNINNLHVPPEESSKFSLIKPHEVGREEIAKQATKLTIADEKIGDNATKTAADADEKSKSATRAAADDDETAKDATKAAADHGDRIVEEMNNVSDAASDSMAFNSKSLDESEGSSNSFVFPVLADGERLGSPETNAAKQDHQKLVVNGPNPHRPSIASPLQSPKAGAKPKSSSCFPCFSCRFWTCFPRRLCCFSCHPCSCLSCSYPSHCCVSCHPSICVSCHPSCSCFPCRSCSFSLCSLFWCCSPRRLSNCLSSCCGSCSWCSCFCRCCSKWC